MANQVIISVTVSESAFTARDFEQQLHIPQAGAIATFQGIVRNNDSGKIVSRLEYEAHPKARDVLHEIATAISDEFDILGVSTGHRFGELSVGELAFIASVASAHRREAFTALSCLVERVKLELPIWKHQIFSDGSEEWVNSP